MPYCVGDKISIPPPRKKFMYLITFFPKFELLNSGCGISASATYLRVFTVRTPTPLIWKFQPIKLHYISLNFLVFEIFARPPPVCGESMDIFCNYTLKQSVTPRIIKNMATRTFLRDERGPSRCSVSWDQKCGKMPSNLSFFQSLIFE